MTPQQRVTIAIAKKSYPELQKAIPKLISQLSTSYQINNPHLWLNKVLNHKTTDLFIATNDKKQILGILLLVAYPLPEEFTRSWIEDVIVDQDFRGLGIGEKLVKAALKRAKVKGYKQVNLTSSAKRLAANALYQKLGFILTETNYYRFLP